MHHECAGDEIDGTRQLLYAECIVIMGRHPVGERKSLILPRQKAKQSVAGDLLTFLKILKRCRCSIG